MTWQSHSRGSWPKVSSQPLNQNKHCNSGIVRGVRSWLIPYPWPILALNSSVDSVLALELDTVDPDMYVRGTWEDVREDVDPLFSGSKLLISSLSTRKPACKSVNFCMREKC